MLGRFLPRDTNFFDYFEKHAAVTVAAAHELQALLGSEDPPEPRARRIKELEHEADVITHTCVEALHKTFITPFDRHEIHRLISRMDDVMDYLESASERMVLYELPARNPDAAALADVLARACEAMARAVEGLRRPKEVEGILPHCVAVNRLENEGDVLLRAALARLFREERDPIAVIKWKEIYEHLEDATDRAEDVANVIEGVILEQG